MRLTQRRVILVKTETERGTDAIPTAATDALVVNTSAVMKPTGEEIARDTVRQIWSSQGHVVHKVHNTIDIEVELMGSGTAGVAPSFGPLLTACAMSEDVTTDTSVAYASATQTPAQQKTCTIYWYEDGAMHKMVGCVATMSLSAPSGIGKISFSVTGEYVPPTDTSLPDPILSDITPPIVAGIGLTIGSYTPVLTALSVDLGNKIAMRNDINDDDANGIAGFLINGREVTGSLDPEADAFSEFNPWADWKAGTTAAISATIGSTAGNICSISLPNVQYRAPSYSDREGVRTYDLPFVARDDAGDPEFTLTFT
jgi:hypothetical protein